MDPTPLVLFPFFFFMPLHFIFSLLEVVALPRNAAQPANKLLPVTGVLAAQAASTILEDDIKLEGGIYTPACLGQGFIDRLNDAGFRFETKMVPV